MPRLRTLVSRIPSAFTADSDDNNHGDQNAQPDQHIIVCGSGAPIEFPQSSFGPCLVGSLPFGTISAEPSPWNRDSLELQYKITHTTVHRELPPSTTKQPDRPRDGIESLAASSATSRCGPWRKPSDETPWRDTSTTGKTKTADWGEGNSSKHPCYRCGGLRFLLKIRRSAL